MALIGVLVRMVAAFDGVIGITGPVVTQGLSSVRRGALQLIYAAWAHSRRERRMLFVGSACELHSAPPPVLHHRKPCTETT